MIRKNIRPCALILELLLSLTMILILAPRARAAEEDGLTVNVDINALNNDTGSFAIGQSHTWILRGGIPQDIGSAKSYILTYEIDPRLTLEPGILVNLHTGEGRQLHLRSGEHYQLERGRTRLRLSLTPEGLACAERGLGGRYDPELRISFRACINPTADMGTAIPGTAELTYINSAGRTWKAGSDKAEVHTGGLHIAVTDGIRQSLEGVGFRLARPASEKEAPNTKTELLDMGGKKEKVVFLSFYDENGQQLAEMITDREGRAQACGLPYGSYYLVESENHLSQPIAVEVNEISHLTAADGWKDMEDKPVDSTIHVVSSRFPLPETEAMGWTAFVIIGICTLGAACPLLLGNRESQRTDP